MTDENNGLAPGQASSAEMSSARQAEHEEHGGVVAGRARRGMFGVVGSGDTSGYGGLTLPGYVPPPAHRPYGGWFDEVSDELLAAMHERVRWLWANDPAWRQEQMDRSFRQIRAAYDSGPGYGHCSIASNGMWCAS